MAGSRFRYASGGMLEACLRHDPAPRRAEGARLRRDRDTRQTARFLSEKGGELEGCPLERVEGRQPFSRSEP